MKIATCLFGAALCLLAVRTVPLARAKTFDLETATLVDIDQAIDAGALTSEKLVSLYLARIEAYDKKGPRVNAVISPNPHALEEARALDAERKAKGPRSPLHGIPVVLKDLIDVAGLPTTAGFKPFGAPIPLRDATITAHLKAAGAIIIAKVATVNWFGKGFDETHPIGASLNPYGLDRSPGGSSNGVGVSMACYFATVGIGTDTGGSVMNPSSFCSLVGMVGTQGLVSRTGIVPRGATQDRAGPMGRNVSDIATLFSIIAGWDAEDAMTLKGMGHFPEGDWGRAIGKPSLAGRRIGVLRELIHTGPSNQEGIALFNRALADMRRAGAFIVDPVLTGFDLKSLTTTEAGRTAEYEKLGVQNAYLAHLGPAAPWHSIQEMIERVGPDKFDKLMVDALALPPPASSPDYLAKMRTKNMVHDLINELVEKYQLDALVSPYNTVPPPLLVGGANEPGVGHSLVSNSGLPGIIVPTGYTKTGLPIAMQFTGKDFDDLNLLKIAAGYVAATQRRITPAATPPLPGEKFDY